MPRALFAFSLIIAISACGQRSPFEEPRPRTNVLTQEEIAAAPVNNAYEALSRLRPRFLQPHATGGRPQTAYAVVYIDGVRRNGGLDEILRSIAASSIMEIRYLTAVDATSRYGLDVQGGVIDVKLRR